MTPKWIGGASAMALLLSSCAKEGAKPDPAAEAPPQAQVVRAGDSDVYKVDKPGQFTLVTVSEIDAAPALDATGVVSPDVSRNIPVVSLASGRAVEVHARLGDAVRKGQLLMRVQSDAVSSAFADYRSAMADERLSASQLDRAKLLYDKGALAGKDLEIAQDADAKAKIAVENAAERIRVLGGDVSRPSAIIDIAAPASGVITEQNVTPSAGVKTLDNSPNLFTVSDLSEVWIICDVYENDLSQVRVGEPVAIRLNAYPDRTFTGKVSDIGPTLDSATRTAKVRVQLHNPGIMRFGMFVTATFHGLTRQKHAVVPAEAILHLHDTDWVYVPANGNSFRRVRVQSGPVLPENQQEILAGIAPGDRVVAHALVLQNTAEQ